MHNNALTNATVDQVGNKQLSLNPSTHFARSERSLHQSGQFAGNQGLGEIGPRLENVQSGAKGVFTY